MFDKDVLNGIKDQLLQAGQTVAAAESVTSGLVQMAFSNAADAMKFYQGGLTAYNIGQKARHLDIDPIHATNCNCVSEKMAADMAKSVCRLFTSDWGIGITGYASPAPESDGEVFAYFAIAQGDEVKLARRLEPVKKETAEVQLEYVNTLLKDWADFLKKEKPQKDK